MSQILISLSIWLHSLATIVFIGHYLLLSLVYLPVLGEANLLALSAISKRSRAWLYASLLGISDALVLSIFHQPPRL